MGSDKGNGDWIGSGTGLDGRKWDLVLISPRGIEGEEKNLLNLINFGIISEAKMFYFLLNMEADRVDKGR